MHAIEQPTPPVGFILLEGFDDESLPGLVLRAAQVAVGGWVCCLLLQALGCLTGLVSYRLSEMGA